MNFKLLLENYLGKGYQIPEDKEKLLFDFYMLEFVDKGPDLTDPSDWRNFLKRDEQDQKEVREALKIVRENLLSYLKEHFLAGVFYAISDELLHLKNMTRESADKLHEYITELDKLELKSQKKYILLALKLFSELDWKGQYGGEKWAKIAEAWLKLYDCPDDERYIWIDHIYDLQHNTNFVLNKFPSYAKEGDTDWIKEALTFKTNLKTPMEIFPNCSQPMKNLAERALRLKGYKIDEFETEFTLEERRNASKDMLKGLQVAEYKMTKKDMENYVKSGADINYRNAQAAGLAIEYDQLDALAFLLDNKIQIGTESLLLNCIYSDKLEIFEYLLKKEVSQDAKDLALDICRTDITTYTPSSVKITRQKMIELLLNAGADVDQLNAPSIFRSIIQRFDFDSGLVELFVEKGFKLGKYIISCIDTAWDYKKYDALKFLLNYAESHKLSWIKPSSYHETKERFREEYSK